jgi:ABC-type uncharacterized transport system ATPase component
MLLTIRLIILKNGKIILSKKNPEKDEQQYLKTAPATFYKKSNKP